MNKSRLILMMGIPGSGKSTFIKKNIESFIDPVVVSRDQIRFSFLKDGDSYFSRENEVYQEFIKQIIDGLSRPEGGDVIVDATHLNKGSRQKLINSISCAGGCWDAFNVIWIKTPLEVALKRNSKRTGRQFVREEVIKNMSNNMTRPDESEEIDSLMVVYVDGKREVYNGKDFCNE